MEKAHLWVGKWFSAVSITRGGPLGSLYKWGWYFTRQKMVVTFFWVVVGFEWWPFSGVKLSDLHFLLITSGHFCWDWHDNFCSTSQKLDPSPQKCHLTTQLDWSVLVQEGVTVFFLGGWLSWLLLLKNSARKRIIAPESRQNPKRKGSYSNPPFSGAKMLVLGRVNLMSLYNRYINPSC